MDIPPWYSALTTNPRDIQKNFKLIFSTFDEGTIKKIGNLIHLFGSLNATSIKKFLPSQVQTYYINELSRLKRVQQICLIHLIQQTAFDTTAIAENHLYDHVHAFASQNLFDLVVIDIRLYLSSHEFPLQETKALGCYSVQWIKEFVDDYHQQLQETIQNLFQWTKSPTKRSPLPTLEQQRLLFKHTAIKGFGRSLSYGRLFSLWNRNSLTLLEKHSPPFCLLYGGGKPQEYPTEFCSFQEFIVNNTIQTIFHHKNTLLPSVEPIEKELYELFMQSETDRQNALFYIDYLQQSYAKLGVGVIFKEALIVLNRLLADPSSRLYNFLHAALYYLYYDKFHETQYLHMFNKDPTWNRFLLQALYTVPYSIRKHFEEPIEDRFYRTPLRIDNNVIVFLSGHCDSLQAWGNIFLCQTIVRGSEKCPYLTLNQQIDFIQKMEKYIGKPLPTKLFADFLFLRSVKKTVLEVFEKVQKLRLDAAKALDLNDKFFALWHKIHEEFIAHFDYPLVPSLSHCVESESAFRAKIEQISFLLQLASYPKLIPLLDATLRQQEAVDFTTVEEPYLVYFLQYLYTLPIKQALLILDLFIPDRTSQNYNLMHATLHYHAACKKLSANSDEQKQFLKQAIFSMNLKEREIFDHPLLEDHITEIGKIDFHLLQFAKMHPIPQAKWGMIILRSTCTISQSANASPFLNLNEHIKLIEEIEKFLSNFLPTNLIVDLLYFQTAQSSLFDILKGFAFLREQIKCHCFSEKAIPKELHDQVRLLTAQVTQAIGNVTHCSSLCQSNVRSNCFDNEVIEALSSLLSFITYPMTSVSFRNLIEFNIQKKQSYNHSLQPLISHCPSVPMWMARWVNDEETGHYSLNILLKNPTNPHSCCLFCVPLLMPQIKQEREAFLTVVFSAVDGLVKERLSENETTKVCNEDFFVEALHTRFLRSFFYTLNPQEQVSIENNYFKTNLSISEEGICLWNPLSSSEKILIKKNNYSSLFSDIHKSIVERKMNILNPPIIASAVSISSFSTSFDMKIQETVWKGTLEWYGEFVRNKEDQKAEIITKFELVKITIANPNQESLPEYLIDITETSDSSETLTIHYPPFSEKESFIDSMILHIALLCMKQDLAKFIPK